MCAIMGALNRNTSRQAQTARRRAGLCVRLHWRVLLIFRQVLHSRKRFHTISYWYQRVTIAKARMMQLQCKRSQNRTIQEERCVISTFTSVFMALSLTPSSARFFHTGLNIAVCLCCIKHKLFGNMISIVLRDKPSFFRSEDPSGRQHFSYA